MLEFLYWVKRVVELLSRKSRKMLVAAREKFRNSIYTEIRMIVKGNDVKKDGTIAALYSESVFYQAEQIDKNSLSFLNVHVVLDDNPFDMTVKELHERLWEAKKNGLPSDRWKPLAAMIKNHKSKLKIKLGSIGLAKVLSMEVALDTTEKPMNVKVCKYTAVQRKFLDAGFA